MQKPIYAILVCSVSLIANSSPYSNSHFQGLLKNSVKLQCPTSSFDEKCSIKQGDFKGKSNEYFYLNDKGELIFKMCGKKNRSEIREMKNWEPEDKKTHKISATLKIPKTNSKKEFTFLQIHGDAKEPGTPNKPLLRIASTKNYQGVKDHIWAHIKTTKEFSSNDYIHIDLGKRSDKFTDIEVSVKNSYMKIKVNKKVKVTFSLKNWEETWNYFKAGVYLQGEGCGESIFKKLKIK